MTAGRIEEARAVLAEARTAVYEGDDAAGRFVLELAESGLMYADGRFGPALDLVEAALRSGLGTSDDTRGHLTRQWRCDVLAARPARRVTPDVDRERHRGPAGPAGLGAGRVRDRAWEAVAPPGRLADAAAVLEEHFTLDTAHEVVSVLDAAGVGALGRVALHTGDRGLARQAAEIARVMLDHGVPSVRAHAVWALALQAMGEVIRLGAPAARVRGEDERMSIVPLFPMDVADHPLLVRIALAAGDHELAVRAVARRGAGALNPDVRSLAGAAAHADGLLRGSQPSLAEAVELFENGARPLALAPALEDHGAIAGHRATPGCG